MDDFLGVLVAENGVDLCTLATLKRFDLVVVVPDEASGEGLGVSGSDGDDAPGLESPLNADNAGREKAGTAFYERTAGAVVDSDRATGSGGETDPLRQ